MMDPEKLIFQGNYELKHGNAVRAMEFVDKALGEILDLDPIVFSSPSGLSLDQIERLGFLSKIWYIGFYRTQD